MHDVCEAEGDADEVGVFEMVEDRLVLGLADAPNEADEV